MNERIKVLRKSLNMTQEEFSKKIGLSRNFIAQVETGAKTPSDRTVSDICREFNVNEEWIRCGIGEMFVVKTRDEQISEAIGEIENLGEDNFKHRLISAILKLDEDRWKTLEELVDAISNK